MPTYVWTQKVVQNIYTLGEPPDWWNTALTPVQVVATESPGGPGDILERCEFSANMAAVLTHDPAVADPFQLQAISMAFVGEVYSVGAGGFPNPGLDGSVPGVITAMADVTAFAVPDPAASKRAVNYSTRGYVSSKGIRGPDKYGGGHPELRIGMFGLNVFNGLDPGVMDSSSTYVVRALWKLA